MRAAGKICSVDSCDKPYYGKGYCSQHWQRWRARGSVLDPAPLPEVCTVEGCDEPHSATGFCRTHYYRVRHISKTYGLAWDEYTGLFEAQDGCCAICLVALDLLGKNSLRVDHCHESGSVRGLLCHKCNIGLGHFDDNPSHLRRAADYLQRALSG